jgi:cobalamin biosynthesis Mg chelatase CobN
MVCSDLYGAYLELEDLLVEYDKAEDKDRRRLIELIREKVNELKLDTA